MPLKKDFRQLKRAFKIVKNAVDADNNDYLMKCTGILAWDGVEFADGTEATPEVLEKLAKSYGIADYVPSLVKNHDWDDVDEIIGIMTGMEYKDGQLTATFDVYNEEAGKKIARGEWRNISLAFKSNDAGDYYTSLECSIVVVPHVLGAKIEPASAENTEDKTEEKTEDMTEDKTEEKTEVVETVEKKTEETANECDKVKSACDERVSVNALKKEVIALNAEIKRLKLAAETREKEIVVNALLNKWQAEGKTAPAVAATEKGLLMSLNTKQLEAYKIIKNDIPAKIFGRLSAAPEQGAKSAEDARFARMKADYEAKIGGKK